MKLAEGGLPKGGGVGYEIFDKSDALGATSFIQNINHLRALEGELARTIRAHRPGAGRARASGAARAAAVLARQGRAVRLDRAQGARQPRAAAGARHPPSGRLRGQRAQAAARLGGRRDRPAARRRRRDDNPLGGASADERKVAFENRLREQVEIDRHLGGRPGPRPRAAHRRFRLQPHHPDLRQVRSRRPRGALEPDPRGKLRQRRARPRPGLGRQRIARRGDARQRRAPASATRTARPRKSSITRFRAPPRPR